LGLTEGGGAGVLGMVETPCAAASLAAEESKRSHTIINVLHAIPQTDEHSPSVLRTTAYIQQQTTKSTIKVPTARVPLSGTRSLKKKKM
jgi:hypothetical protein